MKDVRNAKLRKILDKMGIKDVVLNFDQGFVLVYSDDDLTDTILHYGDNTIEARIFNDFTIDEWVDMIKDIFDDGLSSYEKRNDIERDEDGNIIIHLR